MAQTVITVSWTGTDLQTHQVAYIKLCAEFCFKNPSMLTPSL